MPLRGGSDDDVQRTDGDPSIDLERDASSRRSRSRCPLPLVDKTSARELVVEPPTLVSLGFEWQIDGDDNRNAEVAVFYRKTRARSAGRQGLPLLRLQRERINRGPLQYTAPNMFAGSVFDLEPDTEYECRFVLTRSGRRGRDDGARATVRTRFEPQPFAGGRVYHVYPPGYAGAQSRSRHSRGCSRRTTRAPRTPTTTTRSRRECSPATTSWCTPGSTRTTAFATAGGEGLGTISDGTYFLTQSGTADRPIVIKAAGDGEAIFDGDGAHKLFNVMAANDNYFEGLTFRNAEIVFLGGPQEHRGLIAA